MGENTKIEWADHTQNFWIGCKAISPGCDHCYAEAYAKRVGRDFAQRTRTSHNNWRQPEKWNRAAEKMGRRFRVFTNSLADFFDKDVPKEWRRDALARMLGCSDLDWLVLTKRIGNAQRMLDEAIRSIGVYRETEDKRLVRERAPQSFVGADHPNIWIGATVVNQEEANRDIQKLLETSARVRFLSCEPLLGPINLDGISGDGVAFSALRPGVIVPGHVDWVIAGGESGHGARPMHPDWARALRDQCEAAGVPFLFKQWGEWGPHNVTEDIPWPWGTGHYADWYGNRWDFGNVRTGTTTMARFGKKAAGRLLDGRAWDGFPT